MTHSADKALLAMAAGAESRVNPMAAAGASASTGYATTPIVVRNRLRLVIWTDQSTSHEDTTVGREAGQSASTLVVKDQRR